MISSITNPVRWYDDIFESDRFSNNCDVCSFELISDKTRLLPFQFRRPKSGYPIYKWALRRDCDSIWEQKLNNNDSLFTLDTGYWSAAPFTISGGKANFVGGSTASTIWKSGIFTIGALSYIKIVVSEFVKITPTFSFKLYYTTNDFFNITGPGTYYKTFTADTGNLVSVATLGTLSDKIVFESIEINEYRLTMPDDIDLPVSLLEVANIDSVNDIIQYDGTPFDFQIPCGKYFMFIFTEDTDAYFSELITVKDFVPSQSPYTLLEWYNSCDIADTIYQPINGSEYINRMYIEGDLSKPIYPFKEEGEEDGNYKLNILFQKWEKQASLMAASCPEFIVDALTAIRLNDSIWITKPLRKKQTEVLAAFEVERVETELTSIFNDCATNCELKITLKNKIVDTTCCENTSLASCIVPTYTFTDILKVEGGKFFGEPLMFSEPESVYSVTDGASLPTTNTTYTGSGQYYFTGDQTANFPVGTKVRLTGTYEGIHIITLSVFAIGTTMTFDPPVTGSDTGTMYAITTADIAVAGDVVEAGVFTKQLQSGLWKNISAITNFTFTPGIPDEFFIQGSTYLGIYVKFVFETYNVVFMTSTTTTYNKVYTAAEFASGITINNDLANVPLVSEGTISVKAICYELNCPYDDSNTEVIEFNP